MGKHDIKDKGVAASSIEFLQNKIARLEKENRDLKDEIVFKNDTISQLQKQCSRMSKWASEIEANADDKITELEAENAKLRGKILTLVDDYVGRA